MEEKLISVIVPIYNTAIYLDECITSILNQTYKNFELILVNDGSTDHSLNICRKYEKLDSRVKVIDKENGGVVIARREGFFRATGDYVTFIDSDDYIYADMLTYMEDIMTNKACDLVQIAFSFPHMTEDFIQSHKAKEIIYNDEAFKNQVFPLVPWSTSLISPYLCSKMFKRVDLINAMDLTPKDIKVGEDSVCIAIAQSNFKRICISDKLLYYYRTDREAENSACDTLGHDFLLGSYEMLKFYKSHYQDINEPTHQECINRCIVSLLGWRQFAKLYKNPIPHELIEKLFLFPIWELSSTKKIAIYGANEVGISNYFNLKKIKKVKSIIIDETRQGLTLNCIDEDIEIQSPAILNEKKYDLIIISGYSEDFAEVIKSRLIDFYNVNPEKIIHTKQEHNKLVKYEEVI